MLREEIKWKRMRLKALERLRRSGGATLVVGDDGSSQITVFRNTKTFRGKTKRFRHG